MAELSTDGAAMTQEVEAIAQSFECKPAGITTAAAVQAAQKDGLAWATSDSMLGLDVVGKMDFGWN